VLFGANLDSVGWPAAGEIDATELALSRPGAPFASVHGPGYSGANPISATYSGPLDSVLNRWVEHSLEWEPGKLSWAIDGVVYHTVESTDPRAAGGWPFDQEQFLVLTMTVGSWASGDVDLSTGPRDSSAVATARAEFDYVRFEQYLPC
jgi:beta-glucanase (GH16 family)